MDPGDGSGLKAVAIVGHAFSLAHTYSTAGTFSLRVTVDDGDASGFDDVVVEVVTLRQESMEKVADLIAFVESLGLAHGLENALTAKLEGALRSLEAGNLAAACGPLGAFVNQVQAQAGKGLTAQQADALIEAAQSIRGLLGCA